MRFYEGDHAYEIERVMDPATQLYTGWRYNLYRIRPTQNLLRTGVAGTQEEAEKSATRALAQVVRAENKGAEDEQAA